MEVGSRQREQHMQSKGLSSLSAKLFGIRAQHIVGVVDLYIMTVQQVVIWCLVLIIGALEQFSSSWKERVWR